MSVKFYKVIVVVGSIMIAFGVLFMAQSQSLVGPQSSFMYKNPEWTVNGGTIAGIGAVIIAAGITLGAKRRL